MTSSQPSAWIDGKTRKWRSLSQSWPVRKPRPSHQRLDLNEPLLTAPDHRYIFPGAKAFGDYPGGFGTGNVAEHSLAVG